MTVNDVPPELPVLGSDKLVVIKKGSSFWKWFGITVITCFVVSCLAAIVITVAVIDEIGMLIESDKSTEIGDTEIVAQEHVIKNTDSSRKIVKMSLSGIIMDELSDYDMPLSEVFKKQFKLASMDEDVVGVILDLDTPGGEVYASDLIAKEIEEFQEKTGKPVIACMESVAASGGYYVSAPCRWIVANEITITGSIGVISSSYNYRGLMDKIGVKPVVYKSGKLKDMGRGSKAEDEILPEEVAMRQALIDKMFGRFKNIVSNGRNNPARKDIGGKKLVDNWEEYADGRVFLGTEAYELGFVDEIGDMNVAINRMCELCNIEDAKLVEYEFPFDPIVFFRKLGMKSCVNFNLNPFSSGSQIELKPGRMYYLPAEE